MAHHNTHKIPAAKRVGYSDLSGTAKAMVWILWVVVVSMVACCLIGCSTTKKSYKQTETYVHDTCYVKLRQVDTLIQVEPDTATARLYIECDENNRALVSVIESMQGDRVSVSPTIKYVFKTDTTGMVKRDAYITIDALARGFAERVSILEEEIKKGKTEYDKLTVKCTDKSRSVWKWAIGSFILGVILTIICLIKIKRR